MKTHTTLQSEITRVHGVKRPRINRRAFLRGAGTVAVGLPFLEGLPARSAWAQDSPPIFSFFMVAACGVVGNKFFPSQTGSLSGLASMTDKATSKLAAHADNLLFVKGINFPMNGPTSCGHAQGLCQSLTATTSGGSGGTAYSGGISADMVISEAVNPAGVDPMTLYAGNRKNGYIAERISFKGAGAGQVRAADDNPYALYSKLVGLTSDGGSTPDPMAAELLASRKSVNDLVRGEMQALMSNSALSKDDKDRLQQHFDAIRDAENTMVEMGAACSMANVSVTEIEALESGLAFQTNGMIEDVAKLHMELVALAFACNYNRVGTMQWGDGTDATKYNVPSNAGLGWGFHHLSHRVQSDSQVGSNSTAEQAHAEIDALRMETLAYGLEQFKARNLQDKCFVMWTNHVADGPSHSFKNVPTIIWGNAGGYLKQGQYVDAGGSGNSKLFNTLISAAVRDQLVYSNDFGEGGSGELDVIKAS